SGCTPLSTPPMREPCPPASTTPGISLFRMRPPCVCATSAADIRHFNARRVRIDWRQGAAAAKLRVVVGARFPDPRDGGRDRAVAPAAADQAAQVVSGGGEQAQVQ